MVKLNVSNSFERIFTAIGNADTGTLCHAAVIGTITNRDHIFGRNAKLLCGEVKANTLGVLVKDRHFNLTFDFIIFKDQVIGVMFMKSKTVFDHLRQERKAA